MRVTHQGYEFHVPELNSPPSMDPWDVVGMAAWLWTRSSLHRSWNLALFEQEVIRSVQLQQFVLATRDGQPAAYLSWGHLSEEAEISYIADPHSLHSADLSSGEHLWLLNWVAPAGGTPEFTWVARHVLFHSSVGHMLRVKPNNHETARLVSARGVRVSAGAYAQEICRVHRSYLQAQAIRHGRVPPSASALA